MNFWEAVKKDMQRGIKEGIDVVKEGAVVVRKRAETLTEEAKKHYNIFELKTKVQKEIAELGGSVYDLSSTSKNPLLDKKVKSIIDRIKKMEIQIRKLEGKPEAKQKRKPARKSVRPQKKTA
ncbi:MAG: hypothetical protein ABSA46_03830 [Thermodesulfovibrionales bacterium]|jgi:hypothetical protein